MIEAATFSKRERIVSQKQIEQLFEKGQSRSMTAFPLRAVCHIKQREAGDEPVMVLISVPKKRLKHAVDRNRVKRQVREAYRHRKSALVNAVDNEKTLLLAFLWVADGLFPSSEVDRRMEKLIDKLLKGIE